MKKFEDALNEFQELFSVAAYNMTIEDALSKGVCVKCKSKFVIHPCIFNKKDISNNEKEISGIIYSKKYYENEFKLFGLCQSCFNNLMNKEYEDE